LSIIIIAMLLFCSARLFTRFLNLVYFNTLIQQLLSIDFLINLALVKCFSISRSRVISAFNLLLWRLLIVFAHNAHFHKVLVLIVLLGFSFSIVSIRRSSSLLSVLIDISKVVVVGLSHRSLNIWVLSRSVLHSTMRLESATATLYLGRLSSIIRFALIVLQLVLVVRVHFIVSSHGTMSLLIHCSIRILILRTLFLYDHLILHLWINVLSMILSVKVRRLLQSRAISIFIYFVIVLSSLRGLIALLVWALSSGRIVDAVFVLFILVFVSYSTLFYLVGRLSHVLILVWRLIRINLNHSSLVRRRLLTQYLNLTVNSAWLIDLLFFIFKYQTLNIIILGQISRYLTVFRSSFRNIAWRRHEFCFLFVVSFSALNVAIVFNVKIMCNLLSITHILSRMSNRLLLLILRSSVLLLHLVLLSSYLLLIVSWCLSGAKSSSVTIVFLVRFALLYDLRF